jgi:hypothetical protein
MSLLLNLHSALEDLAAPPDLQARRAKESGTSPSLSEFALDYDCWAQAAWQLVESGEISEEAHKAVLQLNDRLCQFSGQQHADEWHVDALTRSTNWSDVRERARHILSLINSK